MYRFSLKTAAVSCIMTVVAMSCEMAMPERSGEIDPETRIPVEVTVPEGLTRITNTDNEDQVNSLQVFVFRTDGNLDAYSSGTGTSLTVDCTSGSREFIAVANAPALVSVTTKQQFLAAASALSDNAAGSFVMSGSSTKTVSSADNKVDIEISRLAARISVRKITNSISAPAYADEIIRIRKIYISNVAGDLAYSGTGSPTVWLNQLGTSGDLTALLSSGSLNVSLPNKVSYDDAHYFYCYPNPIETDHTAGAWSPRYTRLVVETQIAGKIYYYPVSIPGILSNHTYDIEELIITRLGSVSPDIPVETGAITVSITVKQWEPGSSTDVTI